MKICIDIYLFDVHWSMHIATFKKGVSIVITCLMEIIFTLALCFKMGLEQTNEDPKFN